MSAQAGIALVKLDKPSANTEHHEHEAAIAGAAAFANLSTLQTVRKFWKATMMCFLAALAACSDGYQYTLPGNLVANRGFINTFGSIRDVNGAIALDPDDLAVWGGVYSAGTIVALVLGGYPADYFGRKFNIALLTTFLVIACALEVTTNKVEVWTVGKLLAGFATGLVQSSVATYVSEVAPTVIRGALLGIYSLTFAMGQLLAAVALNGVEVSGDPLNYKPALYCGFGFSAMIFAILLYIPESPRFYARKGKHEQAMAVLRRLNGNVEGYNVELEYAVLSKEVEDGKALATMSSKLSFFEIFKGINLRRTWISFAPMAFQQLAGIPVVFGYTSYFFQLAGLENPFLGTVAVNIILISGIISSFYLVERVGRRSLFNYGGSVMVVCLILIGVMGCLATSSATSNAIIFFMCLWVAAYSMSAGPLGYIFLGESSNVVLRAKTSGAAAAGAGAFGLIFNYCSPLMLSAKPEGAGWGIKTGFFFAGTCFIGLVLLFFTVPETRNRSYLELDELFMRKIPARQFASTSTSVDLAKAEKRQTEQV